MKRILSFLLSFTLLFTACSCSDGTSLVSPIPTYNNSIPQKATEQSATPSPSKSQEPLHVNKESCSYETGAITNTVENYHELIDENEEADLTKPLDIPVYYDEEFVLGNCVELGGYGFNPCFNPGFDQDAWNYPCLTSELLAAFPNNAWRDMGDGRKYLVYDTEKGTRVFFFFNDTDDCFKYLGFPVIMTNRVSYSQMKGIKLGDTIDDVISIDPSARYVKKSRYYAPDEWIDLYAERGCPTTTVHLLTDGVMKITYERTGDKSNFKYTITDIRYEEDFTIKCIGGTYNYKIALMDYVK